MLRGVLKKFKCIIVLAVFAVLSFSGSAQAMLAQLSAVEVSPSASGYDIILKTDKKISYKKIVSSNDQIFIELKNTIASDDYSTSYNDVANISNVALLPDGKNDLKIQIQGVNVSNSNVDLDYKDAPVKVSAQTFDSNEVNLSYPVDSYSPVYRDDLMEEEEENGSGALTLFSSAFDGKQSSGSSIGTFLREHGINGQTLTYLGLIVLIITAGINMFKSSDNTASVGLQSLKERELEIARRMNEEVRETLSLRNKVAQSSTGAPSINYGLRSYQTAQQNPYVPVSTPLNPVGSPMRSQASKVTAQTLVRPTAQKAPVRSMPTRRPVAAQQPIRSNSSVNVDSMKFLESMTKIYEKTGRTDLAAGLKHNIKKVTF